jgi:hypothetical protein
MWVLGSHLIHAVTSFSLLLKASGGPETRILKRKSLNSDRSSSPISSTLSMKTLERVIVELLIMLRRGAHMEEEIVASMAQPSDLMESALTSGVSVPGMKDITWRGLNTCLSLDISSLVMRSMAVVSW